MNLAQNGSLSVADESSSLVSLGADVRALCRTDSLGQQQDFAALMHQTPKIIVDVLAEGIECNIRNTRIEWCPQQPKVLHTASGLSLVMSMTKSALCMITISPLTDKRRLAALIKSSPLLRDRVIPAAVDRPLVLHLPPPSSQSLAQLAALTRAMPTLTVTERGCPTANQLNAAARQIIARSTSVMPYQRPADQSIIFDETRADVHMDRATSNSLKSHWQECVRESIVASKSQALERTLMARPAVLTLTDALNRIRCSHCRSSPCKCADDVEDECTICNEVPCTCNPHFQELPSGYIMLLNPIDFEKQLLHAPLPLFPAPSPTPDLSFTELSSGAELCMAVGSDKARSSVGLAGKMASLSPLQVMKRAHIILAHCTLAVLLATLALCPSLPKSFITKDAIREYMADPCGICETSKMKRRSFRGVHDKTASPLGMKWAFDSIALRKPSAQWGYMHILRFVNEIEQPTLGMRRSYGLVSLKSDDISAAIQTHRAWVRPVHGEVMIYKKDGHPTHRGASIESLLANASIVDQETPPYDHEGVGSVEVTWSHDVPSANALLLGCGSSEPHFFTAFLDVERAGNRSILNPSFPVSREAHYYKGGRTPDILAFHLCYGAPVKYLKHIEIRDSKYDDHAFSGIYRGGSRDDESDHRVLVSYGAGVTTRHITVDIGGVRIDERGVINRCDANHKSHQPYAIESTPPAPAPDFSRWLHPGKHSLAVLDIWTASTPDPTRPTIVVLGAGVSHEHDPIHQVRALIGEAAGVIMIYPLCRCFRDFRQMSMSNVKAS